jgi:hypothetical protein
MNDRELHDAFTMIEANAQSARLYLIRGVRREADAALDNIAWIASEISVALTDRANLTDRAAEIAQRARNGRDAPAPAHPTGMSSTPAETDAGGSSPAETPPEVDAGVDDTAWELAFDCGLCGEPFDSRGALIKHRRKGCPADPSRTRAAEGIGSVMDNSPELLEHTITREEFMRARYPETANA